MIKLSANLKSPSCFSKWIGTNQITLAAAPILEKPVSQPDSFQGREGVYPEEMAAMGKEKAREQNSRASIVIVYSLPTRSQVVCKALIVGSNLTLRHRL